MVITEDKKNTVYFSKLLALAYPRLWGRVCDAMEAYGYTPRKLTHTKDFWSRDYMPIQTGGNQFVQYVYDQDYLTADRKYITKSTIKIIKPIRNTTIKIAYSTEAVSYKSFIRP